MLALIESTASVTPAHSDKVPTAITAASALFNCDEAVSEASP